MLNIVFFFVEIEFFIYSFYLLFSEEVWNDFAANEGMAVGHWRVRHGHFAVNRRKFPFQEWNEWATGGFPPPSHHPHSTLLLLLFLLLLFLLGLIPVFRSQHLSRFWVMVAFCLIGGAASALVSFSRGRLRARQCVRWNKASGDSASAGGVPYRNGWSGWSMACGSGRFHWDVACCPV